MKCGETVVFDEQVVPERPVREKIWVDHCQVMLSCGVAALRALRTCAVTRHTLSISKSVWLAQCPAALLPSRMPRAMLFYCTHQDS